MTDQSKPQEAQSGQTHEPVATDSQLQIDNIVLGVKAQLIKEQAHG